MPAMAIVPSGGDRESLRAGHPRTENIYYFVVMVLVERCRIPLLQKIYESVTFTEGAHALKCNSGLGTKFYGGKMNVLECLNRIDILEHENILLKEALLKITNTQVDELEWCESAEAMYWIAVECLNELGVKVKLK